MNMMLDTLSRQLKTDCCWIQLVNSGNDQLPLVASLGFTAAMKQAMGLMDKGHLFSHEIVGLGHNIVIPGLHRDGRYDIPHFAESGFKSLLAVPIMTYRVHGILGIAYRNRMKFPEEFTRLISVIAGLLGASLQKSNLNKQWLQTDRPEVTINDAQQAEEMTAGNAQDEPADGPVAPHRKKTARKSFSEHTRRMNLFQQSHR